MTSDPAVPELAQPPRTKGGATIFRVVFAVAAIAAVVWYLRSRQQERAGSRGAGAGVAASESGRSGDSEGRGGARQKGGGSPSGGGGGREGRVVTVQVAAAERTDVPIWLEGLGTVAAVQQVTVRPQVDGRIDKVLFGEGQPVKRGDVLVQIDPRPFLVALHQAQGALARDRAQLETLRSNLRRYEGLKAQNLVAGQQVEEIAGQVGQLEGTVRIDQAQLENAQLQLDYAQVKSPLDGIAGIRQVDAGNLIHTSDPNGIVVITAIDPAAVFFTVPQDQLSAVAQALARGDAPVEVRSRDGSTKLATGKLAVLDNQVNQATATLRLKALVPNPEHLLWPNAFVKARMLVETRKDAIVIPTVAVQHGPQGTYVYAVGQDKTAQMMPVTVALTTGETAVIGAGLAGGEQVIVEGQNQVRPGGRVEPVRGNDGPPGSGAPSEGTPEHGRDGRGKRDRPGAAPSATSSPGTGQPSGSSRAPGRQVGGPSAGRPATGQSLPRGPATGPTASTQTPAVP